MKDKIREELKSIFTEEFVSALHILNRTIDDNKSKLNIKVKNSKPEISLKINLGKDVFWVCVNDSQQVRQVLSFDYDITKDTFSNNLFHLTSEIESEINFLLLKQIEITKQNKTLSMSNFMGVFDKLK